MSDYNTPIYCSLISTAHRIFTSVCLHKTKKHVSIYACNQTGRHHVTRWRGTGQRERETGFCYKPSSIFNFHLHLKILMTPLYTHVCLYVVSSGFRGICHKKGLKRPAGEADCSHRLSVDRSLPRL